MPKLHDHEVERNQARIEDAALRVFTRQGFHGTSVREIADEAGVSLGNIYNYFDTKDQLFSRLVERYERRMARLQSSVLTPLLGSPSPASLKRLAKAVRRIVYDHPDYWRLMYIDIVEFGNRHFAHIFRDMARLLERLAGGYSRPEHKAIARRGIDPPLAFAAIYLQFFTYFLVEKLFGGKQHLGAPDDRAIEQLIRIFTAGVSGNHLPPAPRGKRKQVLGHVAASRTAVHAKNGGRENGNRKRSLTGPTSKQEEQP